MKSIGYKKYLTLESEICNIQGLANPSCGDLRKLVGLLGRRQKETDQLIVSKTNCPHHSPCGVCLTCLAKRRLFI